MVEFFPLSLSFLRLLPLDLAAQGEERGLGVNSTLAWIHCFRRGIRLIMLHSLGDNSTQ